MRTALMIALGVIALVIILAVMLQQSNGEGLSSTIAGAGATQGYKKKEKGYEALLNKVTIIAGIVFVVLTVILLVME